MHSSSAPRPPSRALAHPPCTRRRIGASVLATLLLLGAVMFVIAARAASSAPRCSRRRSGCSRSPRVLHLVSLITRSEAWNFCVRAAGGTDPAPRRSSAPPGFGSLASVLSAQLGVATRIGALRRTAPETTPRVPALLAAEVPIIAFEAMLAALFIFTLVGPLHLPVWVPMLVIVAHARRSSLALRGARPQPHAPALWQPASPRVRELRGRGRLVALVILGVLAQIARNWLVLRAVGVAPVPLRLDRGLDRDRQHEPAARSAPAPARPRRC